MTAPQKYLAVIAGPTAVGKTAVAIEVARHFNAEILSADSRQFYRGMDVGTAKPSPAQLKQATHHFIDNRGPGELYGAGHFARDASQVLQRIYEKHGIAILCGGSGLYIQAVLEGIDEMPDVPAGLRGSLTSAYQQKGIDWLRSEIRKSDPEFSKDADLNNPQRMLRALEVSIASGKPFSSFKKRRTSDAGFVPVKMLLNLPRKELYARIDERVDRMIADGLAEETKKLLPFKGSNAMKTVGYREMIDHLEGKTSLGEAVALIKQHTRNYAKRQLTWFRNRGGFAELPPHAETVISHIHKMSGA